MDVRDDAGPNGLATLEVAQVRWKRRSDDTPRAIDRPVGDGTLALTKARTHPVDRDSIDQRLHDSVARAVPVPLDRRADRPPHRRRNAALVVGAIVVGSAVAALVVAVAIDGRPDEAAPTPTASLPARPVLVAYDFDGDGGNCIELAGAPGAPPAARGCASGSQLRSGRPLVVWTGDTSSPAVSALTGAPAVEVRSCLEATAHPAVVDPVVCGPRPLVGVLPANTWGAVEWSVRDANGSTVALTPIDVDGDVLVFELPPSGGARCVLIASHRADGDWSEACATSAAATALTAVGGRPAGVDVRMGSVEVLDASAIGQLGCVDLDDLLRRAGALGGVTLEVRCEGDRAVAVQGEAVLEHDRPGQLQVILERAGERWFVVADGPPGG